MKKQRSMFPTAYTGRESSIRKKDAVALKEIRFTVFFMAWKRTEVLFFNDWWSKLRALKATAVPAP